MFIHTLHKRSLRTLGAAMLFLLVTAVMLMWPLALRNGVSRGLSICSAVIIPTLYPFMILAAVLTDSPLCTKPPRLAGVITKRFFRLPPCCGPAILLSIIGGYPAGALAIGRLYDSGQISAATARRMTLFCVNAGPGFIISTVGVGLLGSARAGLLLFIAHVATSLGMGFLLARIDNTRNKPEADAARPTVSPRPFAVMVQDTCSALLTMCGFVLLASSVLSVWEASGLPLHLQNFTHQPASAFSAVVAVLTEVSCGCIAVAGGSNATPFWLCLCLGWGGLSVQGQLSVALAPVSKERRVLTLPFFTCRLIHGVVSGVLASVLFHFIPLDLPTVNETVSTVPFYASSSASLMLLMFSFISMLCFSKKTGNV